MMQRSLRIAALCGTSILVAGFGRALYSSPADDAGTIRIHLLGHAIGTERYAIRGESGALVLTDTFEFTDRGGRVQLASSLRLTPTLEPISLHSSGRTYRFVNVDADVNVDGDRVHARNFSDSLTFARPASFFAIAGYAPLQSQALLIRYWQTHVRPPVIVTAPGHPTTTVRVEDLGPVSLRFTSGSGITLQRFSIEGVAWGREIAYL